MRAVRKIDARVSWPSPQDASKDPVFATWTCPNCAWTEFDLVEGDKQGSSTPSLAGPASASLAWMPIVALRPCNDAPVAAAMPRTMRALSVHVAV
jgi:hypothetical protein